MLNHYYSNVAIEVTFIKFSDLEGWQDEFITIYIIVIL